MFVRVFATFLGTTRVRVWETCQWSVAVSHTHTHGVIIQITPAPVGTTVPDTKPFNRTVTS